LGEQFINYNPKSFKSLPSQPLYHFFHSVL
jgi:hypothetical protein